MDTSGIWKKVGIVIMLVVFLGSLFAVYELGAQEDTTSKQTFEVGNYSFWNEGNYYATEIDWNGEKYSVGFGSNPAELGNITFDESAVSKLLASKVYLTYDPNVLSVSDVQLAYSELYNTLNQIAQKQFVEAYTKDSTPVNENIPLRTCADAKDGVSIIELRKGEQGVSVEGDCVIISGADGRELLKASSKLAMWFLGIKL